MIPIFRRTGSVATRIALIALSLGLIVLLSPGLADFGGPRTKDKDALSLARFAGLGGTPDPSHGISDIDAIADDLRAKFHTQTRVTFLLTSRRDTSIFVLATGCQSPMTPGWRTETEEPRNEIWRLKAGVPREVCVERPATEDWRAFVRYGSEMHGLALLKAQLREAWLTRSLSNWDGKPWGGGRWAGSDEVVSEEFHP